MKSEVNLNVLKIETERCVNYLYELLTNSGIKILDSTYSYINFEKKEKVKFESVDCGVWDIDCLDKSYEKIKKQIEDISKSIIYCNPNKNEITFLEPPPFPPYPYQICSNEKVVLRGVVAREFGKSDLKYWISCFYIINHNHQ